MGQVHQTLPTRLELTDRYNGRDDANMAALISQVQRRICRKPPFYCIICTGGLCCRSRCSDERRTVMHVKMQRPKDMPRSTYEQQTAFHMLFKGSVAET